MKGALFSRPKKEYRDYAHILNSKHAKTGTRISPWRFRLLYYLLALLFYCSPVSFGLLYYLLSTYFSSVAGVCEHKTTPFMQNKANFRRAVNDCNLSYNKHLRTQTTPSPTKKQSQFKTRPRKAGFVNFGGFRYFPGQVFSVAATDSRRVSL